MKKRPSRSRGEANYESNVRSRGDFHGSYREEGRKGPGPVAGAGELTIGHGPGKAAMRTTPHTAGAPRSEPASGATPKGMKTYNQE